MDFIIFTPSEELQQPVDCYRDKGRHTTYIVSFICTSFYISGNICFLKLFPKWHLPLELPCCCAAELVHAIPLQSAHVVRFQI